MYSVVLAKRITTVGGRLESEMKDKVAGEVHCKQNSYLPDKCGRSTKRAILSFTVRLDYVSLCEMSNVPYRLFIQRNEKHHKGLRGFSQYSWESSAFMYHLK